MKRLKTILVTVAILLTSVSAGYAKNLKPQDSRPRTVTDREVIQACREALVELKFRRENEALLREEVKELKKISSTKDERVGHLEAAIAKYEQAVAARQEAERLCSELRANYEKQMAIVEKQLAISEGKVRFWKTMAKLGTGTALVIGAAIALVLSR